MKVCLCTANCPGCHWYQPPYPTMPPYQPSPPVRTIEEIREWLWQMQNPPKSELELLRERVAELEKKLADKEPSNHE